MKKKTAKAAPKRGVVSAIGCSARPSRKPQNITDDAWYYEYRGHIELVVYATSAIDGNRIPVTVKIPWRKLENSMRRCRPNPTIHSPGCSAAEPR